jgi:hypothetical protein
MRVCQFRHDGNLNCNAAAAKAAVSGRLTTSFYSQVPACQTNRSPQRHRDTEKTEEGRRKKEENDHSGEKRFFSNTKL